MEVIISKIAVIFLLILLRLVSGLLPFLFTKRSRLKSPIGFNVSNKRVEKCVNVSMNFSGGILMAICFIHMLPEVRKDLKGTLDEAYDHFPYAELVLCVGFFLVFLIEETVKLFVHTHDVAKVRNRKNASALMTFKADNGDLHTGSPSETGGKCDGQVENCIDSKTTVIKITHRDDEQRDEEEEDGGVETVTGGKDGGLRNFFLVAALSFHSVMEGMAIGLQNKQYNVWYMFLAVAMHECTILLCVALDMASNCATASFNSILVYILILALISPFGVLIGTLLTLNENEDADTMVHHLLVGGLQGLAAGTILYVTFFEVLSNSHHHHHHHHHLHHTHNTPQHSHDHHHHHNREDAANNTSLLSTNENGNSNDNKKKANILESASSSTDGMLKIGCIILGFAFMVVFELIGGHNHDHGSEIHGHGHKHELINQNFGNNANATMETV